LLPDQQRCDYLFLANISPELQSLVLSQTHSPKVVAADTMDSGLRTPSQHFLKLMERLDILTINDDEARLLSGEHNLVKAGRAVLKMGPKTVLVKRGEYGVLQFSKDGMFAVRLIRSRRSSIPPAQATASLAASWDSSRATAD